MLIATTSITDVLTSAFNSIASDISGILAVVIPIALGIVGTVMVVNFGIKFFRRLMGKA